MYCIHVGVWDKECLAYTSYVCHPACGINFTTRYSIYTHNWWICSAMVLTYKPDYHTWGRKRV